MSNTKDTDLKTVITEFYHSQYSMPVSCHWEFFFHAPDSYATSAQQLRQLLDHLDIKFDVWYKAFELYRQTWKPLPKPHGIPLGQSSTEGQIATAIWAICLPHVSERNPNLIAYYQSVDKLSREIETPIKYGRFLTSVMGLTSDEAQAEVEKFKALTGEIQLRFAENNDVESWGKIYRSPNVKSCMNNTEYEVTNLDTYKCYCPDSFGLPDNGLRLAYLGEPATAYSRAIVNERTKEYYKIYGDSAIIAALEAAGYEYSGYYLRDVRLYTWWDTNSDGDSGWVHPYVDGAADEAELVYVDDANGVSQPMLELSSNGDWVVDSTSAIVGEEEKFTCDICTDEVPISNRSERVVYFRQADGRTGVHDDVCECCVDNRTTYCEYEGDTVLAENDSVTECANSNCFYLDTDANCHWYRIEWSEHHNGQICDAVWSEHHESYLDEDDVVYSDYLEDYILYDKAQDVGNDWLPKDWVQRCPITDLWIPEDGCDKISLEVVLGIQGVELEEYEEDLRSQSEDEEQSMAA